jgi:hypothetical protein
MAIRLRVIRASLPCLLAVACGGTKDWSANDGAVYAAALDSVYSDPRTVAVLLQDSTILRWPLQPESLAARIAMHAQQLRGLDVDMQSALVQSVGSPTSVGHIRTSRKPLVPIASAEVRTLLRDRGAAWAAFVAQHPGTNGITQVSRVVYSSNGQRAALYLAEVCMSLCGHGEYILLQRENGHWSVTGRSEDWVS